MAKILILANNDVGLYKFRKELIEKLRENHEIFISLPFGEFIPGLEELGCKFINTPISRRGKNPLTDIKLLIKYIDMIKKIKPNVVLTYTIKPNVYGGLVSSIFGVPYIANITGLGTAVENKGLLQKVTFYLYRIGLKNSSCVFFQNEENRNIFIKENIVRSKYRLITGSGVNLTEYKFEQYPESEENINFLFIGRVMKAKGINELLNVAKRVKQEFPNVQFNLVGSKEEDYTNILKEYEENNIIVYYGRQNNVRIFIKNCHAIINPSHHEGMSNVLLESASIGRPVLASKIPGCKETFDEGISGLGFKVKDEDSLYKAIVQFIKLPLEQKMHMGLAGRKKMEKEFDRNLIINAYMEEISRVIDS
jgi:glycosyltransferase involved in cell wall biosynthesis